VSKVFRCPTDGRFLRPGMEYTLRLRDSATTVRYAHCPTCGVILTFADGRRPRAVASFAVDVDGVSSRGVRLGSAAELAVAERGVRTIAHAIPAAKGRAPATSKKGRRGRQTRRNNSGT
jgi:hypothetical protein